MSRLPWTVCVLVGAFIAGVASAGEEAPLRFGAMPFLPPERMQQEFEGYAGVLERELQRPVAFEVYPDFDAFEQAIRDRVFDIVWVPPFDVSMSVEAGYTRLVRSDREFAAIFVTNLSNVTSLADLENRHVGMSRPDASTTRLAKIALASANLLGSVTTYHFSQHEACFEALMSHQVSACASHSVPVAVFERASGVHLSVIHRTLAIPSSVIAVHERVPVDVREKIVETLTSLDERDAGMQLLADTAIESGWVATTADEYVGLSNMRVSVPPKRETFRSDTR